MLRRAESTTLVLDVQLCRSIRHCIHRFASFRFERRCFYKELPTYYVINKIGSSQSILAEPSFRILKLLFEQKCFCKELPRYYVINKIGSTHVLLHRCHLGKESQSVNELVTKVDNDQTQVY